VPDGPGAFGRFAQAPLTTLSTIGAFLPGLSTPPFLRNVRKTTVVFDASWGFGRALKWAT